MIVQNSGLTRCNTSHVGCDTVPTATEAHFLRSSQQIEFLKDTLRCLPQMSLPRRSTENLGQKCFLPFDGFVSLNLQFH